MGPIHPHRTRVSRETRLLLTTAFVAVAVLWGLARVRFPDRPVSPNPVGPILTQLAARPALDDLAADIAELRPQVEPFIVMLQSGRAALRVAPDRGALLLPMPLRVDPNAEGDLIGVDPASGLAVVRVPESAAGALSVWEPEELRQPRYLMATAASSEQLAVQPVFVASLSPIASPLWPGEVWAVPSPTDLEPGSFVFSSDARLAGLVVDHGGRIAIVPSAVLQRQVERLSVPRVATAGYIGVEVQPLTPALAKATGAAAGVVVSWVDPEGAGAEVLAAGDVLETVDAQPVATPLHWQARAARVTAGEQLTVRVHRAGESGEVTLVATPFRAQPGEPLLGLGLQARPGAGSVVTNVDAGSASDKAGLRAGDLITRAGDVAAPGPAAVRRAFAAAGAGDAVLVAITRGSSHHVIALEK